MSLKPPQRLILSFLGLANLTVFSAFGVLLYAGLQSFNNQPANDQPTALANAAPSTSAPATLATVVSIALTTPLPSETPIPDSSSAQAGLEYTIVAGDTVWGVAARFNVPVEDVLTANPDLNPDQVFPGNVILIPITLTPSPTPTAIQINLTQPPSATPTLTPSATLLAEFSDGRVAADGEGLRLRQTPGTAGAVLAFLKAATPLQIVGRTNDKSWLEVLVPEDGHGWVMARWVEATIDLATEPVTGVALNLPAAQPTATITKSPPASSATARAVAGVTATATTAFSQPPPTSTLPPAPPPSDLPFYISNINARTRQIYLAGQSHGNNPRAFALVGDSNTDNPAFFAPFEAGNYDLGSYAYLQPSLDYFQGSFGRHSPAAVGSFNTSKLLDPAYADSSRCWGGESPLVCEYRLQNPGVALILIGTGDHHTWQGFESRYRQILDYTLSLNIIPVLITKADDLEWLENTAPYNYLNDVIRRLSQEYNVPLLDLRLVVEPLPNRGCVADGFHYNSPPDGRSADFTGDHLNYGYTVRNLTALQVLDAIRRLVMY